MYFAIRIAIAAAIMIAFSYTHYFGTNAATFFVAIGAGLAGALAALGVKLLVEKKNRDR